MKRASGDITVFTRAAGGWLSAIATLSAALMDTDKRPMSSDWLGWDAWVSVNHDDKARS